MNKRWIPGIPKPAKLSAMDKKKLEHTVKCIIEGSLLLSKIVHRLDIRAGRIYLHRLHEQFGWDKPDSHFIKPLIDGKYAEFPMARITLFDTNGTICAADYQRHTGQWLNLYQGDLAGCLAFIEKNHRWFQ